jgi:hypothetical protein
MVRNYKRKSDRVTNYTKAQLQHAVAEIQRGALNIYRAHKLYQIPKTTLFYHVNGTRGQKSQSQGRPTCISREDERKLAEGLKTMEQWGFGLSRAEVLGLVGEFVTSSKIKTPFKNNIPGDEWFSSFKQRHNLSIKKPQPVEYSRKKMTDPFVINEYFNILARTIAELNINDKPEQVKHLCHTIRRKPKLLEPKENRAPEQLQGQEGKIQRFCQLCLHQLQKLHLLLYSRGKMYGILGWQTTISLSQVLPMPPALMVGWKVTYFSITSKKH